VELSLRCSPAPTDAGCVGLSVSCAHRGPASRDLPKQLTGRDVREKTRRDSRTIFARALLVASRAPGSPARLFAGLESPRTASLRPRSLRERCLAKGSAAGIGSRCLLPGRNPYATEQFDLHVRAGIAAPSRRLRGGIARGFARLCVRNRYRLPLTREAMAAARPAGRREPKPLRNRRVAAPATASTTESARGLMCRELHVLSFSEIGIRATIKRSRTLLFNLHPLSTTLSTDCPSRGPACLNLPCVCKFREDDARLFCLHVYRLIVPNESFALDHRMSIEGEEHSPQL